MKMPFSLKFMRLVYFYLLIYQNKSKNVGWAFYNTLNSDDLWGLNTDKHLKRLPHPGVDTFSVFTPLKTVKRSWCFCIKSELSVHHRYLTRGPRPQCQTGDKLILTITSLQGASIHRASSEPIIKLSLGKLEKLNSLTFSEACVSRQHSVTGIAISFLWAVSEGWGDYLEMMPRPDQF